MRSRGGGAGVWAPTQTPPPRFLGAGITSCARICPKPKRSERNFERRIQRYWPQNEWVVVRRGTSVWQGNWFSVAMGPVSKATQ